MRLRLVEHFHPNLTSIFTQGDISPIMQAIFNLPVLLIQGQQTLDLGFLSREIGKPIHDLLMLLLTFLHIPADFEDVCMPAHSPSNHSFIWVLAQISRTSSRP